MVKLRLPLPFSVSQWANWNSPDCHGGTVSGALRFHLRKARLDSGKDCRRARFSIACHSLYTGWVVFQTLSLLSSYHLSQDKSTDFTTCHKQMLKCCTKHGLSLTKLFFYNATKFQILTLKYILLQNIFKSLYNILYYLSLICKIKRLQDIRNYITFNKIRIWLMLINKGNECTRR